MANEHRTAIRNTTTGAWLPIPPIRRAVEVTPDVVDGEIHQVPAGPRVITPVRRVGWSMSLQFEHLHETQADALAYHEYVRGFFFDDDGKACPCEVYHRGKRYAGAYVQGAVSIGGEAEGKDWNRVVSLTMATDDTEVTTAEAPANEYDAMHSAEAAPAGSSGPLAVAAALALPGLATVGRAASAVLHVTRDMEVTGWMISGSSGRNGDGSASTVVRLGGVGGPTLTMTGAQTTTAWSAVTGVTIAAGAAATATVTTAGGEHTDVVVSLTGVEAES